MTTHDPSHPPTVADVAHAARVSTATVSRALNRPESVRPELRARVLASVARLGYVAHAGARALTLRRSGTVGVIVPTIDNAIFASGLQAFQRRMVLAGRLVLLASSDYDADQELAQADALLARGVDALALTGLAQRPQLIAKLVQRGLPWVHTGSFPAPPAQACVGFRNRQAMGPGVRYLLDLGHRHVAMLAGIASANDRAAERIEGVRQALRAAGLTLPPRRLVQAAYTLQAARDGARALLLQQPTPTALVCGNDVLAWGALLECEAQGLAVPQAVSVLGFDDLELSRHWRPPLSTVRVPTEAMWTLAADYLLARLDGQVALPIQHEVEVELIVRGSTGPAPGRPAKAAARARGSPPGR